MKRRWIVAIIAALLAGGASGWVLAHSTGPTTYTYQGRAYNCNVVMHEPFFTPTIDGTIQPTVPFEVVKYCSTH